MSAKMAPRLAQLPKILSSYSVTSIENTRLPSPIGIYSASRETTIVSRGFVPWLRPGAGTTFTLHCNLISLGLEAPSNLCHFGDFLVENCKALETASR